MAQAVECDWSDATAPSSRRDGYVYRLELHGHPPRTAEVADPPPPALRPLLDALLARAEVVLR